MAIKEIYLNGVKTPLNGWITSSRLDLNIKISLFKRPPHGGFLLAILGPRRD